MMYASTQCARSGCVKCGSNRCSICLRECYCSSECQKVDWKLHKPMCKILKKMLSNQIQSYSEVADVINEIRNAPQNISCEIRILKHLISYAEFQFGDRIQGESYRKKHNGECISNWDVDVNYLLPIHDICLQIYETDECGRSLSMMLLDNLSLPHAEKMLEILRLWSPCLESNDRLDRDQTNLILKLSAGAEQRLASIYRNRNQFSLAEDQMNLALAHARQYEEEGEEKANLLVDVLKNYCHLRGTRGDYTGAVTFAKEAYNIAAVAYNPVHPRVQDVAGRLIQSMTHAGDLIQAETYAQMTLDSLRDPANKVDPEGAELVGGYYNLAKVTNELNKDQLKAEMLIRESLRIGTKYYGNDHQCVRDSATLLSSILVSQGKLGDETKKLLVRCLAIAIRNEGSDRLGTATANYDLGYYYCQLFQKNRVISTSREQLVLSQLYWKEAFRIYSKIFGKNHESTIRTEQLLSMISRELSAL